MPQSRHGFTPQWGRDTVLGVCQTCWKAPTVPQDVDECLYWALVKIRPLRKEASCWSPPACIAHSTKRRWSPKRQHSWLPGLKQTQQSWPYSHGLWIKLGGDGHEERQRIKSVLLLSPILDEKSILFLRLTLEDSNLPKQSLAYGHNLLTGFWNYIILVFMSQVFNHQLKEH